MIRVNYDYAVVGARQDVDKTNTFVTLHPDRREHYDWLVEMDPETAIRLARQLNRWAKVAKDLRT